MEFSPFDRGPDEVLDAAFPNPDLENPDSPLVDDLITDTIYPSGGSIMQEEVDNHERMTRKLFGSQYGREYPFRHVNRNRHKP